MPHSILQNIAILLQYSNILQYPISSAKNIAIYCNNIVPTPECFVRLPKTPEELGQAREERKAQRKANKKLVKEANTEKRKLSKSQNRVTNNVWSIL
jgi:hypothetical protein